MIFKNVKKWWQSLRCYVTLDPADNSVTLSKALFNHIKDNARANERKRKRVPILPNAAEDVQQANARDIDEARVFVFKVSGNENYGFMTNPGIEQPTQMCDIQYNDKYRCVGFETLCPSVGQILYNYGLPADIRVKLSVSICYAPQGKVYYQIEKPYAKYIRKYT